MEIYKSNVNPYKAWFVILVVSGFFCYEFFQINMFNALDPQLMATFNISATTLSFLSSLYFYGTVLLLIPAGLLLDRLSPKKLILGALTLSLFGTLMFSCASNIYVAGLGRFIVGITGGPFGFLSTVKIASNWFPERKMAFVIGVIVAIGMLGGIIAQAPFTTLVDTIGWRNALLVDICVGISLLILLWRYVQDCPPSLAHIYAKNKLEHKTIGFTKGLALVAAKPQNWLCGIFASLLNLPIFLLGALWGNIYLQQVYGFDRGAAANITTMLFVGMLVGSPFFGKISDATNSRKKPMLFGNAVCLLSFIFVMQNVSLPFWTLMFAFFAIGFGSSAQIIVYPTIAESNPKYLTGSAEGLGAVLIMSGGAVFQPIFGWLMDYNWDQTKIDGVPVYSLNDFTFALALMPVCMLICFVALYFIKETMAKYSVPEAPRAQHVTQDLR